MASDTFYYLFWNLDADGFEPGKVEPTDKWEGEDEDDDIKDAWDKSDSEDDNSKDSNNEENKITKTKPKKKLADKIAEREALKEKERADRAPLTEEEKLAEKLRLQKLEENANNQLLRDMCGKSRYVMLLNNVKKPIKGRWNSNHYNVICFSWQRSQGKQNRQPSSSNKRGFRPVRESD